MNKNKFERVKDGDTYWTIEVDSDGSTYRPFEERHLTADERCFNSNNYFHTRERAEKVANKINTLLKLERLHDVFCSHYKPVWNGYERNYYVRYCVDNEKWTVRYDIDYRSDVEVYFSTEMIALQVCDILNKELI